ncbi:chemotaxis-specific protein-glutamate methyltransferase CheB [Massilia sp. TS11]|uniref:chemotaxis-specific protein-glutamate methyltransferase CheB n=1 Tax=Massilia sp. TS11 TaxID=2908003 RepID=UPI001EDA4657|nr:chemotaxis-specific protein-glutamate methyltransferase CheB [Massilia sp. TS11]MCG2586189.1 chemotaxis-specific protein-glutamate methyltransferase CheB [Massilia sp. TS11]
MRIGIVNDRPMAAEALRRVIAATADHQVHWIARSGEEALRLCLSQRPDLVLMDLVMPGIDGVEATRQIMAQAPCAILIVTSNPQDQVGQVFRALGAGALDVTATPVLAGAPGGEAALLAKIRTIGKLVKAAAPARAPLPSRAPTAPPSVPPHLLAVGASTGGPLAVARLLAGWTLPASACAVVVQHIDAHFADLFAKWLGEQISSPVIVIEHDSLPRAGHVHIARTNDHLVLDGRCHFGYTVEPRDYPFRPSVDVFFQSVARHWPGAVTAAVLTGMGRDGAAGLLALRTAGHTTLAQDQASSAVFGMPRAAQDVGAAQHVLPIESMSQLIRARMDLF